jgi:hypothetical protein
VRHPHDHSNRTILCSPCASVVDAPRPRWEAFVHSLFEGCDDADARILLLQEFFGASIGGLAPRFQKCLVLHGPGGNGKSQVLAVLEGLLPPNTVVHIPPAVSRRNTGWQSWQAAFPGAAAKRLTGPRSSGGSVRSGATSASPWRTPAGNKRSGSLAMARSKNGPHVPITGTPRGPRGASALNERRKSL